MPFDSVGLVGALLGSSAVRPYWEALGRFVSTFSLVEENVQVTLWRCVSIKAPIGPAIFSGTRTDAALGYMKRIAEAKNWSKQKRLELDYIAAQLGEITRVRNDILHYGASASGENEWIVSNKLAAHTKERIRETKISPEILDAMTDDLYKIIFHLILVKPQRGTFKHAPGSIRKVLERAWRYKPEKQQGSQEKRRATRQARKGRPRSSRA